jgi:hypothetical protein
VAEAETVDFRGLLDFPYSYSEAKITKKEFQEMDLNKCFEMCFPGLLKGDIE